MTRDDFTTLWKMLVGVWPRLDTDESIAAWWGLLSQYPANHATGAVRHWSIERRTPPTPSDIISGIKAAVLKTQREEHRPMLNTVACDQCENYGFVWTSVVGQGTVARCPRGCLTPRAGDKVFQYQNVEEQTTRGALEALNQSRAAQARRLREIGHDAYLVERGRDPKYYRIQDGLILLRPEFA